MWDDVISTHVQEFSHPGTQAPCRNVYWAAHAQRTFKKVPCAINSLAAYTFPKKVFSSTLRGSIWLVQSKNRFIQNVHTLLFGCSRAPNPPAPPHTSVQTHTCPAVIHYSGWLPSWSCSASFYFWVQAAPWHMLCAWTPTDSLDMWEMGVSQEAMGEGHVIMDWTRMVTGNGKK